MKREIKFRAWNKRIGWSDSVPKMEYNGFIIYPENGLCEFPQGGWDIDGDTENPDGFILMQYTGIKDKNGKEIYEGDIVKLITNWVSDLAPENTPTASIREVTFKDGSFILGHGGFFSNHFIKSGIIEVIGNIYDTPELLN